MPVLHLSIHAVLCCCLLAASLPVLAMSQSPEDAPTNDVSIDMMDDNPEKNARTALDKGDIRLLGFALRATSVPGIAAADRKSAMNTCGVRLMRGFGDVIRKGEDMTARQQAFEYAKRYNAVVLPVCLKRP